MQASSLVPIRSLLLRQYALDIIRLYRTCEAKYFIGFSLYKSSYTRVV